ncbi:peptidyl-prolyl cis-trans isomerase FKBP5 [Hydra vulgaris]|uniref:peptidylprolyl isomerase n=1 Tax=Hydra vulgaris TaxID=6087 RepID=T2MDI9_HYDVU|nr:peptidyl-prolyl cis-trans isomerase FKBP5 [Hydra vulgaris]
MTESTDNSQLFEDITPKKDGGILKKIIKCGEGEEKPFEGCKAYVHYVGKLSNGEVFDSSRDKGEVFSFIVGRNSVIKGWDMCMPTMLKNEICEVKISPDYGYGKEGIPPRIPENSTLYFEIELLAFDDENVTNDGGVRKRIIKVGDSPNKPNIDSSVKIHIRGSYQGNLFDERDVEFVIGEGYQHNIVDGIEKAICKMKRFEKSKVFVRSEYAYKDIGNKEFDIPPNADEIEYEVCLFKFERAKEIYEMEYPERIERSKKLKESAAKCFQAAEYEKANGFYERIIKMVNINEKDSQFNEGVPFLITANCNSALCYLKLKDFINAKKKCENVLKLDRNNVKAYFRLGEAMLGLNEFKNAVTSFEYALKLEPTNSAAKSQLANAKLLLKQQLEKEKKLYGNIFSKLNSD